jgi:hypothetical protein
MYHGLPMGQIFSTDLGADGFVEALEAMAAGLPDELGYVQHAWFRRWLDIARSHPERLETNWVQRSDIQDSLVLPLDEATPTNPFSLPLFSLDYGLAYSLHRDCIISRMTKTVLKRFLSYEERAKLHAFPPGTTLHGTCAAKCVYLWKARPPMHRSWRKDHGIAGFIKNNSLPLYFHDRVEILQGWNTQSLEIPWETTEETQLHLDNADTLSQSALATQVVRQVVQQVGKKRPPMDMVDLSGASAPDGSVHSGDVWDLDGRRKRFREHNSHPPPQLDTAYPSSRGHSAPPPVQNAHPLRPHVEDVDPIPPPKDVLL